MLTKLQKIISKIEKRHSKKIDLSLDRTFNLLNKLGNPQNKIKNVINEVLEKQDARYLVDHVYFFELAMNDGPM